LTSINLVAEVDCAWVPVIAGNIGVNTSTIRITCLISTVISIITEVEREQFTLASGYRITKSIRTLGRG